jgi:hypothetical protein
MIKSAVSAATLGALAVGLAPLAAVAQGSAVQRTPWGHPDLEGLWTNATLTPFQRPAELGTKAFYEPDEVAAIEQDRRAQTNADRELPPGQVGSYNDFFFERGSGIVATRRTSLIIDPPDGLIPALTPEAERKVETRAEYAVLHPADTPADRWLTERCILFGGAVPMFPEPYNNNYKIVQTPDHVTILVELNHETRVIPLDGRPTLPAEIQQWIGDSRGHWESDTLVVETRNLKFNEQSRFGVNYLNGISDENLHVVERFTRTDADTILYQATIEDPTVFTQPWTVEIPLRRTPGPIYEVACHEGNYGLGFILSGHRAEERAAAEAAPGR